MSKKPFMSVVIPCYCCESSLKELCLRLDTTFNKMGKDYEIILVNDHSPQDDWSVIKRLSLLDKRVKGINLSRNFGQHYALTAGLDHTFGEWVVVMDGDLEDFPEDIERLYNKASEGYQIVYGLNKQRGAAFEINNLFSKLYYSIFDFLAKNKSSSFNASFVLMSRLVVDSFCQIKYQRRQFAHLLQSLGYDVATVETQYLDYRVESGYTFQKKLKLAFNGLVSHSTRLLRVGIYLGFIFSLISFLYGLYVVLKRMLGFPMEIGWSSLISSIFFVGGLIMIILGILGIYIENIIHEVKQKPLYFIKESINLED